MDQLLKGLQTIEQIIRKAQREGILEQIAMPLKGIAPTICGVKAGELLTYPLKLQGRAPSCYRDWQMLRPLLSLSQDIKDIEVKKSNGTSQIFLYHQQALRETLMDKDILAFLREQGYPPAFQGETHFEIYLESLANRLKGTKFPHEIGVFLGYPLNDVKGFMGCGIRPLAYIQGWQVYDPPEAAKLWMKLTFVRESIEKLVDIVTEEEF